MSKLRIAFGIPAYGGNITVEQAQMWLSIGSVLSMSPERFELAGMFYLDSQPIDKVRNTLLEHALAANADWLLMIDADTFVVGDESGDAGFYLLRMISDADRAEAAIVAAPYVLRGDTDKLAVFRRSEGITESRPQHEPITVKQGPRQMYEAFAVGTGCFAVHLGRTNPRARRLGVAGLDTKFAFSNISEDLNFCAKVREDGGRILVDGRVMTGHMSRSKPLYSW